MDVCWDMLNMALRRESQYFTLMAFQEHDSRPNSSPTLLQGQASVSSGSIARVWGFLIFNPVAKSWIGRTM
jgi:hypothetical protein